MGLFNAGVSNGQPVINQQNGVLLLQPGDYAVLFTNIAQPPCGPGDLTPWNLSGEFTGASITPLYVLTASAFGIPPINSPNVGQNGKWLFLSVVRDQLGNLIKNYYSLTDNTPAQFTPTFFAGTYAIRLLLGSLRSGAVLVM